MLAKAILVTILANGGGFSHSNIEVSDREDCMIKGKAWVEQMAERGYDRYMADGSQNPSWKESDGNRWADFNCVELPGKF